MLKSFWGFLLFLFCATFGIIVSFIAVILVHIFSVFSSPAHIRRSVISLWGKSIVYASFSCIRVHWEGKPPQEPCVIITNHRSIFDIFILAGFFPIDFLFLSKEEAFGIPLIGGAMRKAGYISVNRKSAGSGVRSTMTMIDDLKTGDNILIFPEGTRNLTNDILLPFKEGVLFLAEKANVPILPVVLCDTGRIYTDKKPFRMYPAKIDLSVLKPIFPQDKIHPSNKKSKLSSQVRLKSIRDRMEKGYRSLSMQSNQK